MPRPKGSRDKKPRPKRPGYVPPHPLDAPAKADGRTERLASLGCVSPAVYSRLMAEGRHLSWPERVEHAINKLIAFEMGAGKSAAPAYESRLGVDDFPN